MEQVNVERGTWNLEPGTWNLEPGTWNLEPGTWNLPAVVAELKRDTKVLFAQLPHRFLQVVFRR